MSGDVLIDAILKEMMIQERVVMLDAQKSTGQQVVAKIPLEQKNPGILVKCWAMSGGSKLFVSWQKDPVSGKYAASWEIR